MIDGGKRAIKVAVASSGLGHITRGIETWAEDLGHALWDRGVDVTLFKGGGKNHPPIERRIHCIQRYSKLAKILLMLSPRFGWRFGFGSPYQIEQLTFALSLIPALGDRYDIVHMQDPYVAYILRFARKLKLIKAKEILGHGTEEPPEFLQQFDYLQQLAPHHLQEVKNQGYDGKYWCAIPNFVDVQKFRPRDRWQFRQRLEIPESAFVILCVAAVKRHHKRIDWLIQEVASLKERREEDIFLVVAGGRTDQTQEVMDLGKKLLQDNVRFFLNLPRREMSGLYSSADVFVICSLKEMMPIALLEAIASGLPAVGHFYPVIKWMIGPGGECMDMTRERELAQKLEKYLDNDDYRKERGLIAREWAVQEFSTNSVVDRIIEMYMHVLES